MKIKEIMTQDPAYVTPDTPVIDVARQMRKMDVGMLPIGDGTKLRGMVTDRDIVLRGVAGDAPLESLTAADVMTPEILYAFEDQSVEEAADVMRDKKVRRLIILDRDKQLTGILSLGDLATRIPEPQPKAEVLEGVSR